MGIGESEALLALLSLPDPVPIRVLASTEPAGAGVPGADKGVRSPVLSPVLGLSLNRISTRSSASRLAIDGPAYAI